MADDTAGAAQPAAPPGAADGRLLDALRRGDERAFESLIDQEGPAMLRVALLYAPTRAIAEEVVQETWLVVIGGLHAFEGRSSLRTWIFRILINKAKSSGVSERRTIELSADAEAAGSPAVDPSRFEGPPRGYWSLPNKWDELPEKRLLATETLAVVERAMERLPRGQQAVFELRDLRHWTAAEVCDVLEVTDGNQRVLLHRARARMRSAIEEYFDGQ